MNKKVIHAFLFVLLGGSMFAEGPVSSEQEPHAATLQQKNMALAKENQQQVCVVNCFELSLVLGLYNTKLGQVERIMEQIPHKQKIVIPKDFFINRLGELVNNNNTKMIIGFTYGLETRGAKNSYFTPSFKGILLEIDDVVALANMCEKATTMLVSMIMIGEFPVIFVNAPETGMTFSIRCGELKTVSKGEISFVKKMLEDDELVSLLFACPLNKNAS